MRRSGSWLLYAAYLLVLTEIGSRAYWWAAGRARFFGAANALAYAALYPEVHDIEQIDIRQDDPSFDILLLGGSTLTTEYGDIARVLLETFTYRMKRPVRVHVAAAGAQTTRDDYLKYRWLSTKRFDLVILYDGINETRANNCPSSVFRADYSHYAWYRFLNDLDRWAALRASAALMSADYLGIKLLDTIGVLALVPTHHPRDDWVDFGADLKTVPSFRDNVSRIVAIAAERHEPLVLMTLAFYVPADYTWEKFDAHQLDYTLHDKPIEMWGRPANVVAGVEAHNRVVRELAGAAGGVRLVDQEQLIPKSGAYFNDICHFTHRGTEAFVANLMPAID